MPQLATAVFIIPVGVQIPTSLVRIFSITNWGSLMRPAEKRYPDRKEGGRCRRIEKVGESERRSVMGRIGPQNVEIPNPKGCRRPTGLDGKESFETPASLDKVDGEHINH